MNRKALVALAMATAFSVLGTASTIAKDDMGGDGDRSDRGEPSGSVVPCSLKGIHPAAHPEIFGSPAVAASYGFVQSRNGTWHVRAGCRR
jgi:hypothetical protein